jgi:Ca2+-binding EF-hand superfamily protein
VVTSIPCIPCSFWCRIRPEAAEILLRYASKIFNFIL